jgi:uncharacterized cupredoxin-like copper-binding protein
VKRIPTFVAALAAIAFVAAAGATNSKTTVTVTEKEWKVTPLPSKAKPGSVTFKIKNTGHLKHEFIVVRTTLAKLPIKGAVAVIKPGTQLAKIGAISPGKSATLTLSLKAGTYELLCNLPAHYAAGQHIQFKLS